MTTQNINKNSIVTPSDSSINQTPVEIEFKGKESNGVDSSPNPKVLRDSLEAKRQLISLLEKGGYVKSQDFEQIKADVNKAIADLDSIIELFTE